MRNLKMMGRGDHVANAAAALGRLAIDFHKNGDDKKCDHMLAIIRRLARVTKKR